MKKVFKITGIVLLSLVLLLLVGFFILNESRPTGKTGPEADALAKKIEKAVNKTAWDSTGAISWVFGGRHEILWDKDRQLARVRWNENEVFVNLTNQSGVAFRQGEKLSGTDADALVNDAWAWWVNDAFWLNPLVKLFDEGVTRSLVNLKDGKQGLLVSYASGGVTPGDAYLWILGDDYLPEAWKMWVSIVPVGGLELSWEDWQSLPTGAKIATHHQGLFSLKMTEIKAAAHLHEIEPEDPFSKLLN